MRILPLVLLLLGGSVVSAAAQRRVPLPPACALPSQPRCITVSFAAADLRDVVAAFAAFSGHSIVLGKGATAQVTAEIRDQPWSVALDAILRAHGLAMREVSPGILRVDALAALAEFDVRAPLVTRVFRISYVPAQEIATTVGGLLSERGSIATSVTANALIVTDTEAAVARIAQVLGR